MKTPSNDLFLIIQSLSNVEKRQFRAQYQQESRTLDLFEIISGMGEYDEQAVKARLDDAKFVKNLKVHKVRLQQQVLSFLRQYKTDKTLAERIREQLDYVDILFQRKLYAQAFDLLAKLEKQAEAYEEYELLFLCLTIKWRQEAYMRVDAVDKTIVQIKNNLATIENYMYHAYINNQINQLYVSPKPNREELIGELVVRQLIDREEGVKPLSDTAARMRNYSLSVWRQLKQDVAGACAYTRANIQLCKAKPKLYAEKTAIHFNILVNHIVACSMAKNYEEALQYIESVEDLAAQLPALEAHLMYPYFHAVASYKSMGAYQFGIDFFIKIARPNMEKYGLTGSYTAQLMYLNAMEIAYFLADYDLQRQIFENIASIGQDLEHHLVEQVLLVEMLFYVQAQDWLPLNYWIEALQKRLQRHKKSFIILRMGLAFGKKLAQQPDKVLDIIAWHQKQVLQYGQKQGNYYEAFSLHFDYGRWLENLYQAIFSKPYRQKK